ncbi:MAG: anti-sigma factor domain-containing protein [Bacillota bacterium]|nr:anti-sigma factor domain-containing protein [Bacillota bacterium]MDW7682484.1 anti-sigma factor domain-containing protein [Bacillota bacterium]
MKTRGIVLEVEKNNVTVLTPDGRYCRLPRYGQVQIGQEYCQKTSSRPWMTAAAIFLLILASSLYSLTVPPAAAAFVTVDINPSLEIGVSARHDVVSAEPMNDAARDLLEGLEVMGLPLAEALEKIFFAAEAKQYLTPDSPAIILSGTPAGENEADFAAVELILENSAARYSETNASEVAVAVVTANRKQREEARELGLSVGKYAVLVDAQNEGIELDAEALRNKGIGRALLDLEEHPGEVLQRVQSKKQVPAEPAAGRNKRAIVPGKGPAQSRRRANPGRGKEAGVEQNEENDDEEANNMEPE